MRLLLQLRDARKRGYLGWRGDVIPKYGEIVGCFDEGNRHARLKKVSYRRRSSEETTNRQVRVDMAVKQPNTRVVGNEADSEPACFRKMS